MIRPEIVSSAPDARQAPFLVAYVVVFIAAFVALAPLLQIILPLHAGVIDAAGRTRLLSQAMFWGALTAAVANVAAGALSDRTTSRFGRRRPWIAAGGILVALSYVGILRSQTPLEMTLAVVGFQIAFNTMMAPFLALFAECVSLERRTTMSAILGVSYPLAVALGSGLMALGPQSETGRLWLLALVVVGTSLPFALFFRQDGARPLPIAAAPSRPGGLLAFMAPFRVRNFALVWSGRFFVATGYAFVGAYLLYFIAEVVGQKARTAELSHSILTAVALVGVFVVAVGVAFAGRRIVSRKPVALAGAVLLCAATSIVGVSLDWPVMVSAFVIYGLGQGFYGAVEMGLMADVLPAQEDRGKDMGLINLAVALPQAIAPIVAILLLDVGGGMRLLFGAAALCFGAGAASIAGLRYSNQARLRTGPAAD